MYITYEVIVLQISLKVRFSLQVVLRVKGKPYVQPSPHTHLPQPHPPL